MLLDVAERDERMAFVDAPADPQKGRMRGGFRVSMGTVPDYAFTGKGMKLTGVRADAPAARAGMLPGDVIVKVGSHEILNVHDFMYSLGELEPGREVEVVVDRGGTRIPLKVIPAPSNR
jgi:S1-C subfamily serine protease